jgi:competence protein ComEC
LFSRDEQTAWLTARMNLSFKMWFQAVWAAEANRRPLWLAAGFGMGAALYFLLPTEPPSLVALTLIGPTLVLLWLSPSGFMRQVALFTVAIALGFAAGQFRVWMVDPPYLNRSAKSIEAEVCVLSLTARTTFTTLQVGNWSPQSALPKAVHGDARFKAQLRWRSPPSDLRVGERLQIRVRLLPVSGPIYPGSYDPRRKAFFDGVGAEGWIGKATQRLGSCHESSPMETARHWFRDRILSAVPDRAGGILVGVTTRWRGDINRLDVDVMRDAGLGHLLAISGLHVGLVVGLVVMSVRALLALCPWLALRFNIKKWSAVAGLLAGILYLAFSGGSVPTQRAMIMLGLVLVALLFDRVELSMRPIAWAAIIVLAFRPEAILSPSFQLPAVLCRGYRLGGCV